MAGRRYALCLAGANLGSMSQRRAAMLLIVTDDGRLLLHHRDDKPGIAHPGCWAGFGGAVEEGESVEEALRREVLEETGLVIEEPRLLTEAVDVEGGGRLVSLFYVRGSFKPEQIELHEGAGVGVHSLDEIDNLNVTPFVRRAINSHLAPLIRG
jgi:8-oxo-dGTP diphosphatase